MKQAVGILSAAILKIPFLEVLLQRKPMRVTVWKKPFVDSIAGWGLRPSTRRACAYAQKRGLPYMALEDGFLRSFGTGEHFPPLSLVVDDVGIYYDCERPSALEQMLTSDFSLTQCGVDIARLWVQVREMGLSKYNHAPDMPTSSLRSDDQMRVLVVDQTVGDMSVLKGGADASTFSIMLAAALKENPDATVYVKTHPEVSSGRKRGYLTAVESNSKTVVLRDAVNPMSLLTHMDKVYVVSSTMGFEALLAGKPVTCFGVPWYSGWGVTDDRQPLHSAIVRRSAQRRSVQELFTAAYVDYTRYLNPETRELGKIGDVANWLQQQKGMAKKFSGRMICVGFRRWRAWNLREMLSLHQGKVIFVRDAKALAALTVQAEDCLVCWGAEPLEGMQAVALSTGARLLRMEDGFVRSVGLGSDLIPPQSFVLDSCGAYFDPGQASELEEMLNTRTFTPQDLERARNVRSYIVENGITKYNLEVHCNVDWKSNGRKVILVPGQVEDDASIRLGCNGLVTSTNLGLLKAARHEFPDGFIVFKPHPDVSSGNRRGRVADHSALTYADHIEINASVISCIDACQVVVTMTSLTGFDALLRGKHVIVHGQPFYAGWGLTDDKQKLARRLRQISMDELVAGALLHYPIYWDPLLKGYTSCEAVLKRVVEERSIRLMNGSLEKLKHGFFYRLRRKATVIFRSLAIKYN